MPPAAARPAPSAVLPLLCLSVVMTAGAATAHAGGGTPTEATFEAPAWLVWATGAGVVALSFVVVGAFATARRSPAARRRSAPVWPHRLPAWLVPLGRGVGLALLALVCLSAVLPGGQALLPPTLLWIVVWSGLPILAYTVGNVWEIVNPFRALEPLAAYLRGDQEPANLPAWLGCWPATVLLLATIGFEVWSGAAHDALTVSRIVLAYTALTVAGMATFGADAWLRDGEVVTRAFRHWSAPAPLQPERGGVRVRAPTAVLGGLGAGPGHVAFIIALLYGVNFDAFLSTRAGGALLDALGGSQSAIAHVGVLVAGYAVFVAVYWGSLALVRRAARTHDALGAVGSRLAPALIPIAVGYHLAHNAFYVAQNAPRILITLSDPLGLGWDEALFGPLSLTWPLPATVTAAAPVIQMVLIVAGHVLAVVAGHRLTQRAFPSRVQAVRGEWPLTLVMVAYTFIGLWIVGQGHASGVAG